MAQFLGVTSKFAESRKSAISDLMEQFLDRRLDHFRVDYLKSCDWLALVDGIYQALSRYQDCTPLSADQQARLRKEFSLDEQLLIELNNSATATQREQVQRQTLDAIVEENRTLLESLEQIGRRLPYLDADGVKAASELSQLRSKLAAVKADRADMAADRRRIDIERLQLLDISHMAVQDKQRLEKELAVTKEGIANLTRIKDEFTTSYTSMEAECEVKNNELSKAVEELTELKDLHKQMSNELRELRLIRASRIWRMMAPLRWMLNSLYRN